MISTVFVWPVFVQSILSWFSLSPFLCPFCVFFAASRHFSGKEKLNSGLLRSDVGKICVRSVPSFVWDFSLRILSFVHFVIAASGYIVLSIVFPTYSKPNGCQSRIFSCWASVPRSQSCVFCKWGVFATCSSNDGLRLARTAQSAQQKDKNI